MTLLYVGSFKVMCGATEVDLIPRIGWNPEVTIFSILSVAIGDLWIINKVIPGQLLGHCQVRSGQIPL